MKRNKQSLYKWQYKKNGFFLRRNLPVPLNQLDKNFWKLFYSPHDVKKWTQGGDPKKVVPLSVIIASPLSTLTWTAATSESGGRVKKAFVFSNLITGLFFFNNCSTCSTVLSLFAPCRLQRDFVRGQNLQKWGEVFAKLGSKERKTLVFSDLRKCSTTVTFTNHLSKRHSTEWCAKLRYKKMHHSSPRRVWKAKAKDWNVWN